MFIFHLTHASPLQVFSLPKISRLIRDRLKTAFSSRSPSQSTIHDLSEAPRERVDDSPSPISRKNHGFSEIQSTKIELDSRHKKKKGLQCCPNRFLFLEVGRRIRLRKLWWEHVTKKTSQVWQGLTSSFWFSQCWHKTSISLGKNNRNYRNHRGLQNFQWAADTSRESQYNTCSYLIPGLAKSNCLVASPSSIYICPQLS